MTPVRLEPATLRSRVKHSTTDINVTCTGSVLLDFSLTVKSATLIFISGCGSAISYAKEGKSGFVCNLVKC